MGHGSAKWCFRYGTCGVDVDELWIFCGICKGIDACLIYQKPWALA